MSTWSSTAYRGLLLFHVFCTLKLAATGEQSSLYKDEIRSLSELPMDKLIQIKYSLADEEDIAENDENGDIQMSSRGLPLALPVTSSLIGSNGRPIRRYGDHYDEKGKDTKISKIFQLAITALSFLAFGGYLLTLIITAIRRNAANPGNGNLIVFSNLQSLQTLKRPKRNILLLHPMANSIESERLYEGMIMLSRSYALYN